jgi:hypothetical protein
MPTGSIESVGQTIRTLICIPRLFPTLTDRANAARFELEHGEYALPATPPELGFPTPHATRNTGHLDVRRVLNDL